MIVRRIFALCSIALIMAVSTGIGLPEDAPKLQRIACVGDSITFGAGIKDRTRFSYPAQLSAMLGNNYIVKNFGASGTTLLKKGDSPYWRHGQYKEALKWNPDIVIVKLGTNDTKMQNWKYRDDFESDLTEMLKSFISLPSKPKVFPALPVPAFHEGNSINGERVRDGVLPVVKKVAAKLNLTIIDYYTPMLDKKQLFPDGVHPKAEGAFLLAATAYNAITGKKYDGDFEKLKEKITQLPPPAYCKDWHGFKLYDFKVGDAYCKLVAPKKAAPGNPWIWRARFFGHEPQTDIALLKKGYYVAYCEVGNLFGAPPAVKRWNTFYDYATKKLHLSPKPILEGMSRGGLIIFNWAAANPDKVAAIYGDAPVCDIKSWPGSMGKGNGWPGGWPTCKKVYGLESDEDARAFKGNPVDKADVIAKAGIPVIIVYGKTDKVVPPSENCLLFAERFKAAGGNIKLIGKDNCGHHPHSLKNPAPIVDFLTGEQTK